MNEYASAPLGGTRSVMSKDERRELAEAIRRALVNAGRPRGPRRLSPGAKRQAKAVALLGHRMALASDRAELRRERYRAWATAKIAERRASGVPDHAPLSVAESAYRSAALAAVAAAERDLSDTGLKALEAARGYFAGRPGSDELSDTLRRAAIECVRVGTHAGRVRFDCSLVAKGR